jgi:uncharacterized protein (TIGR03118 family)
MNKVSAKLPALSTFAVALSLAGATQAAYIQTNLVANSATYAPQIVDPTLLNAWGIALRPAGAGGHWWITSNGYGTSNEYVGDANGVPLFQDELKLVDVPGGNGGTGTPTGVVFNGSNNFHITQSHPNGAITNAARFLFVTDGGVLSAWTERKNPDNSFDRSAEALAVVDQSANGAQFFGLGINQNEDRLFVADFGANPGMHVFDSTFTDITSNLSGSALVQNPFVAEGYQPFNVQSLGSDVFVAYAKYGTPGEEETGVGLGRLAQYDDDGNLVATWDGGDFLNAPWGLAFAPSDWGNCAGALLVSNFGDGTIACLSPQTLTAYDYVRDSLGNPISVEGIWGLTFGNGQSLGDANALYFAAGPNDETDGLFGRIDVAAQVPQPSTIALFMSGLLPLAGRWWRGRRRYGLGNPA